MAKTLFRILSLSIFVFAATALAADPGDDLRAAAMAGDEAKVRALLDAGAAIDAPARHGQTALYFAAERGHLAVVRLLVERGASLTVQERFFGISLIDAALQSDNQELVLYLLDRGGEGADRVLAVAAERDNVELARKALATGRVEPLDLAAVRKSSADKSEALRQLLENAVVQRRQRPPHHPPAERLPLYAGNYFPGANAAAALIAPPETKVEVAVKGEALELKLPGHAQPLAALPVAADHFETADGKIAVYFAGRGGTVEWLTINQEGDLTFLARVAGYEANPTVAAREEKPAAAAAAGASAREKARPWPQFRGDRAAGNGDGQGAPAAWDVEKGEGVAWKTPIPGIGLASPVIWGDRIYLTTAISGKGDTTFRIGNYGDPTSVEDRSEHSFRVYALDRNTGKVIWEREVFKGPPGSLRHLKSSLANSSPVTDGERVVVLFGAIGKLLAYDQDGNQLWQRELGVLASNDPMAGQSEWGHAASPILAGDLVIVQADRKAESFLAAYKLSDGSEAWRVARSEPSTWATPTLVSGPQGDELVVNGPIIRGYDPRTGAELWRLGPNSEVVVATPVAGDGLIYVTAGYPPIRPVYAIRPGQRGDLTLPAGGKSSAAVAWSHDRGGTYVPSPIYYRGHLHTLGSFGILTTYHGEKGEILSTQRLDTAGLSISASPVAADGRLYIFTEEGKGYVMAAGPAPALLGIYPMGETVMATPAISDGLLVVRTLGHVVALKG